MEILAFVWGIVFAAVAFPMWFRSAEQRNLTNTIRPMFDQRALPVTEDIMFRWRVLLEEGAKRGTHIRNRT